MAPSSSSSVKQEWIRRIDPNSRVQPTASSPTAAAAAAATAMSSSSSSSSVKQEWIRLGATELRSRVDPNSRVQPTASSPTAADAAAATAMASSSSSSSLKQQWICEQNLLKQKLITRDDFPWTIPTTPSSSSPSPSPSDALRYVGGVDVSVARDDANAACAALVVLDLHLGLRVAHQSLAFARLHAPYAPGFLAFREVPVLVKLLEDAGNQAPDLFPQVLMVDGNGILHPRGFGLACHLGVLTGLPTIGIGKNLHCVDGLTISKVKDLLQDEANHTKDFIELVGQSGQTWGAAMRSNPDCLKPIFVSVGHRISLDSCLKVVRLCCKFRVPEPVRQADKRSRRCILNHGRLTNA